MKQINSWKTEDGKIFLTKEEAHNWELNQNILKKYNVTMYFTGTYNTTIEAYDEEEAKRKANVNFYYDEIDFSLDSIEVERI